MKKKLSKEQACGLCALTGVWLLVNAITGSVGLWSSDHYSSQYREIIDLCDLPMSRYEVVLPGFQVGCWLKQPLFKRKDK